MKFKFYVVQSYSFFYSDKNFLCFFLVEMVNNGFHYIIIGIDTKKATQKDSFLLFFFRICK